jgi:hypothetical protein
LLDAVGLSSEADLNEWRKRMRTACVLALFAAVSLALTVAPASAKPGNPKAGGNPKAAPGNPKAGGNSKAAHQCQHGGWKNLRRADQTPFKNTGACVSYAARGGTLTAPKSAAQLLCESFGGVFAPGSGNALWFCTYTVTSPAFFALANQCFAEGGNSFGFESGNPTGLRTDACRRF